MGTIGLADARRSLRLLAVVARFGQLFRVPRCGYRCRPSTVVSGVELRSGQGALLEAC